MKETKESGDYTESSTSTMMTSSCALPDAAMKALNTGLEKNMELIIADDSSEVDGPSSAADHPASSFDLNKDETEKAEKQDVVDESSSEDENADLKSIQRFNSRKEQSNGSMRRVDSLERFITRSQRLSILGKDRPPPAEEVAKRRVQFRPEEHLETVHVLNMPSEDEDELTSWTSSYYMTDADFDRNDADIKLTLFRWENHLNGKIRFDESESSLRGLEFFNRREQLLKDKQRQQHRQRVLEEALLLKTNKHTGTILDRPLTRDHWEILRKASRELSDQSLQAAQARAHRDHIDFRKAWGEDLRDESCEFRSEQDDTSLDKTFGINAVENARRPGKYEHQERRQKSHSKTKAYSPTKTTVQHNQKKKNPLLFWKK